MKNDLNITFYAYNYQQYHVTIYFNQTFSSNLSNSSSSYITKLGYSCFEVNFEELRRLKTWLLENGFKEVEDK